MSGHGQERRLPIHLAVFFVWPASPFSVSDLILKKIERGGIKTYLCLDQPNPIDASIEAIFHGLLTIRPHQNNK
jgi:hypothetical protein